MKKYLHKYRRVKLLFYVITLILFNTSSFSQELNSPPLDDVNNLYLQCVESIDNGTINEIKQSFNQLIKTFSIKYDKSKLKKLPGLFYQAAELLSASNDKSSTVDFYWVASQLYEEYYGSQNIFIPITIKKIGNYLSGLSDYSNAISYYKAAIDPRLNFSNAHLASCKIGIGICYSQLFYYQAAENIFLEVLEVQLDKKDKDSIAVGNLYNNVASVNAKSRNFDRAYNYYCTALQYYTTNLDKEKLNQAYIYNNLGNLLLEKKDYSAAFVQYEKGLKLRLAVLPEKSIELTQSYYNIGYCYSHLGLMDSALYYCQKSILSNALEFDTLKITSNPTNSICLSKSDLLISLLDKGEYLIKFYQTDTVNHKGRLIEVKELLKIGEELFHEVEGKIFNFKSKLAWSSQNYRLSNLLIHLEFLLNNPADSTYALLAEADNKRDFIYKSYTQINKTIEGRFYEYSLLEQNKQTSSLKYSGFDIAKKSNQVSGYFQFDTIVPSHQVEKIDRFSIAAIQNKLDTNQAIVSLAICDSLIIRHVISKTSIDFKPLISTELKELVTEHLKQIRTYGDFSLTSRSIFDTLFKDISKLIEPYEKLIIIPDEYLFDLPFETLQDKGDFLIDRYEISYSFSLSKLLDHQGTRNHEFSFNGFSPIGIRTSSYEQNDKMFINDNYFLNYADIEIDAISYLFVENRLESTKNVGKSATISKLIKAKDSYGYIHIATHNIVNTRNPWMSYMQFFPDSSFSDGKLYLPVIYSLGTNAKCLILSGCGTGLGKINNNDGVLSVAHAFSCNPIKNLILSLWNIDDKYTSEFMVDLYQEIVQGKSIGESLCNVKRDRLKSDSKHPFFWSTMLHYYNSL